MPDPIPTNPLTTVTNAIASGSKIADKGVAKMGAVLVVKGMKERSSAFDTDFMKAMQIYTYIVNQD